jgi:hypothetical protein
MVFVQLDKSDREGKKYKAVFYDDNRKKIITTHFGAKGYEDYTTHHDDERKQNYLSRHSKENWNDFMSAGIIKVKVSLIMIILKDLTYKNIKH